MEAPHYSQFILSACLRTSNVLSAIFAFIRLSLNAARIITIAAIRMRIMIMERIMYSMGAPCVDLIWIIAFWGIIM